MNDFEKDVVSMVLMKDNFERYTFQDKSYLDVDLTVILFTGDGRNLEFRVEPFHTEKGGDEYSTMAYKHRRFVWTKSAKQIRETPEKYSVDPVKIANAFIFE